MSNTVYKWGERLDNNMNATWLGTQGREKIKKRSETERGRMAFVNKNNDCKN